MKIYTGDHIIMQIVVKDDYKDILNSIYHMDNYLRSVTTVANMTALTAPIIFQVPFANELNKFVHDLKQDGVNCKTLDTMEQRIKARETNESGVTGSIIWAESHACAHSWSEYGFITIDLYSCKEFPIKEVIEHTKNWWHAKEIVYRVINRHTDHNIVSEDIFE